jgi:hypothetical protein
MYATGNGIFPMKKIPYFRHDLGDPELRSLAKVLEGEILTTGDAVAGFEAKFAAYLRVRHAFGVARKLTPLLSEISPLRQRMLPGPSAASRTSCRLQRRRSGPPSCPRRSCDSASGVPVISRLA